jgi:UDP-N-acetylglucosamine--N-acetylmuramyl-(pentapeptide) pyrophosphoryl-undecaprenol N-acetylglucosamine transferase
MSQEERRFAVVAGGGTAGHVLPVLAVARAIVRQGHDAHSIEIMGSNRGQEAALLQASEFPFVLLPGRGLLRRAAPADLWANARSAVDLSRATARAVGLLRAWQPAVVVTVGGYASFPAGFAAAVLRIPIVLVNPDAVPGLVHRALDRVAAASAVAFPGTPLRRPVVTGSPVREDMGSVRRTPESRRQARLHLGVPEDRDLLVVFGGSLGARTLNRAVEGLVPHWFDRKDLAIYHVVGRRNWDPDRWPVGGGPGPEASEALWYRAVPFEERMPLLYEAADLVVCRAGAMTVGELALTGVPSLLVPLPGAPDDHQTANAQVLVRAGAAQLVPDDQCDAERLGRMVEELLRDPGRRRAMSEAARQLGSADAAQRVAQVVVEHAR